VHHRKPIDFGGDNAVENFVALEPELHARFTGWWKSLKARVAHTFGPRGMNEPRWRRIVGGEEDATL
jgi:hypothetical protein